MNYKIDFEGLQDYLETLTYTEIKEGDLIKAHARDDIDLFYKTDEEKSNITLDQVIEYGMPFLVDAIGNDLSVCILTKRKHKLPTGRIAKIKFVRTVINDCRTVFGSTVNDYYVIPDRFIKQTN